MMAGRLFLVASLSLVFAYPLFAQDAAATNPEKYKVILENDSVRVLDYQDHPGETTTAHSHPRFVLYALSDFQRTLTFPDGKTITRKFKTGDVIYMEAQTHIGRNVGDTDTHVVIVELKQAAPNAEPEAGAQ
ncbi:MAG: cytoplasmic protein [Planctomycetes bacterium]|nr:cytoplasmic protein [Planctomycetota bacterium]